MFPTTHDISPRNINSYLPVLLKLLEAGNDVLIVSKPTPMCIERICKECTAFKNQILFRFTIGSSDDAALKYWEPGAPSFKKRLASLQYAHENGYQTSVSCEPMLDTRIDRVVDAVKPYVTDAIWLGRVNRLRQTLAVNCPGDQDVQERANTLLSEQSDDFLLELHKRYKNDPKIKFKDSIKKAAGLDLPSEAGLDI
jgi:hypothetical protein